MLDKYVDSTIDEKSFTDEQIAHMGWYLTNKAEAGMQERDILKEQKIRNAVENEKLIS